MSFGQQMIICICTIMLISHSLSWFANASPFLKNYLQFVIREYFLQNTENNSNFQVCIFYLINDTVNGPWTLWVGRDCASTSSVEIFLFDAKIYLALLCIFHHAPFWTRRFSVSFYMRFFLSDLLGQSLLLSNSCWQFLHITQSCFSIMTILKISPLKKFI